MQKRGRYHPPFCRYPIADWGYPEPGILNLPYNISLQACSFYQPSITAICNRQNLAETINEYSEELEAWLDIQFADEYDDFTSQPDFDPIAELMVSLEMLTALLSRDNENSL